MLYDESEALWAQSSYCLAHNVSPDVIRSALFGFQSAGVTSFRAPYEVFTRHAVKQTKEDGAFKLMLDAPVDQDRYHDEDLISLFSIESRYTHISIHFQGLRLSSAFVLSIIEVRSWSVLSYLVILRAKRGKLLEITNTQSEAKSHLGQAPT